MTIKRNKPVGAPLKLTPELQDKFVQLVKQGNYFKPVCSCCGIARSTFNDWMSKGEADAAKGKTTVFSEFMDTVRHAEAEAEVFMVSKWREVIDAKLKLLEKDPEKIDPRIFRDFLASRYNDRWGRNVTQTNGKLDIDVKKLSDQELQDVIAGKMPLKYI